MEEASASLLQEREAASVEYKIIMAGNKGVGKTTLLGILAGNEGGTDVFTDVVHTPSVSMVKYGTAARKERAKLTVTVQGVPVKVVVWDTGDMEVHSGSIGVTKSYFHDSDGVILIYKKSDPPSVTQLSEWAKVARENSKDCIFSMWCNNVAGQFGSGPSTRDIIEAFKRAYEIDDRLSFTYTTEDKISIQDSFRHFVQHIHKERQGKAVKQRDGTITGEELSKFERFKKTCKC